MLEAYLPSFWLNNWKRAQWSHCKRRHHVLEMPGIEPGASYMRSMRSTTELQPLFLVKMHISAINSWCLMIWGNPKVPVVKGSDICCAETQFDIVASDNWRTSFSGSCCGELAWLSISRPSLSAGFEPARGDPNGFQVQRLNHSATTTHIARGMSFMIQNVSDRNVWHWLLVWCWRDVHWISKCAQWKISGIFVTDIGAKNM